MSYLKLIEYNAADRVCKLACRGKQTRYYGAIPRSALSDVYLQPRRAAFRKKAIQTVEKDF